MSSGGENGSCSLVWAFVFCLPETQYQLKIYTPKALVWSNGLCHCLRLCTDILVLIQNSDQKTRKEDHVDFFFFFWKILEPSPREFSRKSRGWESEDLHVVSVCSLLAGMWASPKSPEPWVFVINVRRML